MIFFTILSLLLFYVNSYLYSVCFYIPCMQAIKKKTFGELSDKQEAPELGNYIGHIYAHEHRHTQALSSKTLL